MVPLLLPFEEASSTTSTSTGTDHFLFAILTARPKFTFLACCLARRASQVAHMVKTLPVMQETWVQSPGRQGSLEKEMATYSSTLASKIPWTEEPGAGYCPWGQKE